jgi:3-dehydroshikimate dehydratase
MVKTGLTSVTFRKLPPVEIVGLVKQAGLQGIEWGGDIHVPHGNVQCAREVHQITCDVGLEVSSYGSYYKVGCGEDNPDPFERVLETAIALQAPVIRVWAGNRGSDLADQSWWRGVIKDAQRISVLAKKAGVILSFEYHEETLTDTSSSACRLLQAIEQDNFLSYWQPPLKIGYEARLSGLREISPWLSHIHVFHSLGGELGPLNNGEAEWVHYMKVIHAVPGDRYCLLEFVKGESVNQFLEDAQALIRFCI